MSSSKTTSFQHPYIVIQIYDNTEYTEEETVEERKSFNGMQVGFFAGGRDNQLLYMIDQASNLREFGNPNYKALGQAAYNVDNALATGNCGMYVMNLRPDTATFANIVLMVRFKVTGASDEATDATTEKTDENSGTQENNEADGTLSGPNGETDEVNASETTGTPTAAAEDGEDETSATTTSEETIPKLVYTFYAKYIEGANTVEDLKAAALELMETEPDENGYYNMPICVLYSLGRGEYGNSIHLQLSNVTEYVSDDGLFMEYNYPTRHNYMLTIMEPSDDGLVAREQGVGTFDVDGFDATSDYGPSIYIEDVIDDLETGSQRIGSKFYPETLDVITSLYNTEVVPGATETPYSLDLFTCYGLDGAINEHLSLDTEAEDYLNVFSLDGFVLKNGNDGWDNMSDSEIEEAKTNLLIKAYSGDIDPYIKSRFSSPVNFNLDAGYDVKVKKQMAALANTRLYDCMTYLDMGTVNTTSGLVNLGTVLKNVYGFNVIKEGHCYSYRDTEYTGKVCRFTITHWLAKALPNHMASDDTLYGVPLARDTAILKAKTDYIRGTFEPVIDPDSNDLKNTLYKLRINCYETISYNAVQRSTAITTCQTSSDRLLEMNEYILQRAVKIAYDLLASKIYKLGEESDRAQYEQDASDVLTDKLNKYVRTASVEFEMTAADEKKSLLRLKLHLTFKTVIQRGELDVYLDPRVTDDVTTTSSLTVTTS
jgi:hypothetical protein